MKLRKPELSHASLALIGFLLFVLVLVLPGYFQRDTVLLFEAPPVSIGTLEMTGIKLEAHEGLQWDVYIGTTWGGGRSPVGGVIITGVLKNISGEDVFIPAYGIKGQNVSSRDINRISTTNFAQSVDSSLDFMHTRLETNNSEFSGFYLLPFDQVEFALASTQIEISDLDPFELAIDWHAMDSRNWVLGESRVTLHFTPTGSSKNWGDKKIEWRYPSPQYRGN